MTPTSSPMVTPGTLVYPGYRYTPFAELSYINTAAAVNKLDYGTATWDLPGTNGIESYAFESLTSNLKDGVKTIGFPIETYVDYDGEYSDTWDCYVNHYFDYSWATLVLYEIAQYFEALGWTEEQWSGINTVVPLTENLYWEQLSDTEIEAADMVCYFQQIWDMEDTIGLWPDELRGEPQV